MAPAAIRHLFRSIPSIAKLENRALISVTGSHTTEFLNGLLSTSVRPQVNQYSAFLHAQGRVMYDVFLYTTPNGFIMEYDARESEATPLLAYLKRHVLRSKVKVRLATEEYDIWAAWGSEQDKLWETTREWSWARSGAVEPVWNETSGWPWGSQENDIRDRRAVGLGRRLLIRKDDKPPEAASYDIVPSDAYSLHRTLHGVPEGSSEIVPMQAFPMESNLDAMGGLDFRKGCYVGQELTVRTYHTGVIRKRILPVYLADSNGLSELPSSAHSGLEIKPVVEANGTSERPRPRGNGRLLSSHGSVGLALLRLDHVTAMQKGDLKLSLQTEASKALEVIPWWPDWWPTQNSDAIEDDA